MLFATILSSPLARLAKDAHPVYNCVIVVNPNDEYCVVMIMCGSDVGNTWLLLLFMIGVEIISWCWAICEYALCAHAFMLSLLWNRRLQVSMLVTDNCPKLDVVAWSSVLELRVAEWSPWVHSWLGPSSCKESLLRSVPHA